MSPDPSVHLELGADLPVFDTYSRPLEQILQNLFSNAIKHSESGSCKIVVDCQTAGKGFYEIAVKDDGPGIDAKYHERVFGMFKTLKPRDQVEGSGMGLALVKKLVEMQNGTVSIDSKLGAGCTVKFLWPEKIHSR